MDTTTVRGRRDFLLSAGLGAAGAAVLPATTRGGDAAKAGDPSQAGGGYRASPHVLKYYRTAGI
jgi:hypothetical protein